jgi:1-deoxy-D-xylulose-5-phosphate synthase
VAIYSTFLQRGYDQLIHDVAIQNLPVVFALDRGGLVGGDGATHNGAFDYAFLRTVPNLTVMAPADEVECRRMLTTAYALPGPSTVRYPRGSGPSADREIEAGKGLEALEVGRGEVRRRSSRQERRIAILAFGSMLAPALAAADELDATVANMRFVKPLDLELIRSLAAEHELLVTVEEHAALGGAGGAVCEALAELGIAKRVLVLGLPDRFVDHGDPALLLASVGLDRDGILRSIRAVR